MIGNRDALGESRRRRVVLRLRKPRMRRQMARHLRRGSPPTDGQTFWRLTLGISFLRMRVSGTDWAHPAEIRPARRNVRRQMARPLLGGSPPTVGQTSWRLSTERETSDGQTSSPGIAADRRSDLSLGRQLARPFLGGPSGAPAIGQTFSLSRDRWTDPFRSAVTGFAPTNGQTSSRGIAADSWTDLLASQEGHRGQMDRTNDQTSSPFWRLTPWHLISGNADR